MFLLFILFGFKLRKLFQVLFVAPAYRRIKHGEFDTFSDQQEKIAEQLASFLHRYKAAFVRRVIMQDTLMLIKIDIATFRQVCHKKVIFILVIKNFRQKIAVQCQHQCFMIVRLGH